MKKLALIFALLASLGGYMSANAEINFVNIGKVSVPLIFEKNKNLPVGEIQLVFVGGSVDAGKHGLAALASKILNEGTKNLGSVGFAKKLESKAISLYAGAGLQTLSLHLAFLKEYENEAIALLGELLNDINLTQGAFDKVKSLSLDKIASKEDNFDTVASNNLDRILFKGTPMSEPLIGTKQSVESISLNDVKAFLKRNLALNRLIIVAGGDMDISLIEKNLASVCENLPQGEKKERVRFNASNDIESISVSKPTKQAFIYFGAPFVVADSTQNYIARVMSFILGGSGFGSRIMEEVRVKRGLAYSAYLRISVNGAADYASGHLQTKLENKDEALKVVKEVIKDFIDKGATQEELDAAKAFLLGSEPLREETLSQRLSAKFNNYFRGLPLDQHKRDLELIKTLDLQTLNHYIKSHTEMLNMSVSIVED